MSTTLSIPTPNPNGLEHIIKTFEESSRNNVELAKFVKDFGNHFFKQLDEKNETIETLQNIANEVIELSKFTVQDINKDLGKIKELQSVSNTLNMPSGLLAESIFWN